MKKDALFLSLSILLIAAAGLGSSKAWAGQKARQSRSVHGQAFRLKRAERAETSRWEGVQKSLRRIHKDSRLSAAALIVPVPNVLARRSGHYDRVSQGRFRLRTGEAKMKDLLARAPELRERVIFTQSITRVADGFRLITREMVAPLRADRAARLKSAARDSSLVRPEKAAEEPAKLSDDDFESFGPLRVVSNVRLGLHRFGFGVSLDSRDWPKLTAKNLDNTAARWVAEYEEAIRRP